MPLPDPLIVQPVPRLQPKFRLAGFQTSQRLATRLYRSADVQAGVGCDRAALGVEAWHGGHDALEVLALLVEDYEKRTFLMDEPDPVEAIRF